MTSEETEKVKGPGRGHQWVRSVSAVVVALSAIAVALGVLTMAEESIDHTDLMNDQNELLQRQADLMGWQAIRDDCVDQLMAWSALRQWEAVAYPGDFESEVIDDYRFRIGEQLSSGFTECFIDSDGVYRPREFVTNGGG